MRKSFLVLCASLCAPIVCFSQVIEMSLGSVTKFICPNNLNKPYSQLKADGDFIMHQFSSNGELEQTVYRLNMINGVLVREWFNDDSVRVTKTNKIIEVDNLDLQGEEFEVKIEWDDDEAHIFTNPCTEDGVDKTCIVVLIHPSTTDGYERWNRVGNWKPNTYNIGFTGVMESFEMEWGTADFDTPKCSKLP